MATRGNNKKKKLQKTSSFNPLALTSQWFYSDIPHYAFFQNNINGIAQLNMMAIWAKMQLSLINILSWSTNPNRR